jgi:hypothetical protein
VWKSAVLRHKRRSKAGLLNKRGFILRIVTKVRLFGPDTTFNTFENAGLFLFYFCGLFAFFAALLSLGGGAQLADRLHH